MRWLPLFLTLLATPTIALAAPSELPATESALSARASDVVSVMQGSQPPDAVFTPTFLREVPAAKLAAITAQLVATLGTLSEADPPARSGQNAGNFTIRFSGGKATARFHLEPVAPFRVTSLVIDSAVPDGDGPARLMADFAALPGRSGFAVVRLDPRGAAPILAAHADEQFAIGSTFKLWVLDALAHEIAAGRRRWTDVIRLGPRSVPSGIMQDWPAGAAVTLETLATLMISRSDNTATDTLIRLLGREAIARRAIATGHSAPDRLQPILMTAEAFALKLGPETERQAFSRGSAAGRTKFLAAYRGDDTLADRGVAATGPDLPVAIDSIEWFASANDIARVLDALRRRSDPRVRAILAVNPGFSSQAGHRFAYVGYKGGSETGVINLSWLLQSGSGGWYVVTASWNDRDKPVDDGRMLFLTQRLIALIP